MIWIELTAEKPATKIKNLNIVDEKQTTYEEIVEKVNFYKSR